MDTILLLEKLNKLDDIKHFISFLEVKFLSREKLSSQLKIAKNSLDKALINLAFDVQKKLENSEQNQDQKIQISKDICEAYSQLEFYDDIILKQVLRDLISFAKSYENQTYQNNLGSTLPEQNSEELKNLKTKLLLITSERFN